jgi:exosortase/archaeosortase family protein
MAKMASERDVEAPGGISTEVGFGLRFFALLLLASVVFWVFTLHTRLGPMQRAIAYLGAAVERGLMNGKAVSYDDNIVVETLTLNVNHECTGIFVFVLFASFVLAYPTTWRARFLGLAAGLPLLFAINVFRLATLARIVEVYPDAFFYFHEYVWQGFFMVIVLVGAITWAERYG